MIAVHGLLGEPSAALVRAAADADLVMGGRRQLDALEIAPDRRIELGALDPAIERLVGLPAGARALVVASGDPLFFGIVRRLRAGGLRPTVVPAPSSAAVAFAAVGLPWDDAVVVSAHGRSLAPALHVARAHAKVAVFTSAAHGVRELAAGLADQERWYVLAERLGDADQRVRVLSAEEALEADAREPHLVLVLDRHPDDADGPWSGWLAAPDRPPRPEVCAAAAVAYVRLLPAPGELLWARGILAAEVAALARWGGASAVVADDERAAPTAAAPRASGAIRTAAPTPDHGGRRGVPGASERHSGALISQASVLLISDLGASDLAGAGVDRADLTGVRAIVLTEPTALPAGFVWSMETIGEHTLTTGVRL